MSEEIENDEVELNTNTEVEDAEEHIDGLVIQLAKDGGWSDRSEWRGKADAWKPADKYVERQLKRVTSLEDRLRRMESVNEQTLADIRRREREAAREELAQAIDAGDKNRALAASQRIAQDPLLEEFKERNSNWLGKDKNATEFAHAAAQMIAMRGGDASEQLRFAEEQTRKMYPNLFQTDDAEVEHEVETPKVQNRAPAVQPATRSTPSPAQSAEKGWGQIPRLERDGMQESLHMLTKNYGKSKEDAQKQLAKYYWSDKQ